MPGVLATVEICSPTASVLIVTNAWPTRDRPAYGIFTKRQVDNLIARGVDCEVLFVRSFESPLAYAAVAARLAAWNLRPRRRYRLVHAHGEAALCARFYLRAPLVVSYMGSDLNGAAAANGSVSRPWRMRARVMRMLAYTVRATITKSAAMEAHLPPRRRSRNRVLPNGVNRALFAPRQRAEARAALGWSPRERIVLFAAAPWIANKRFGLAQAACAHAATTLGEIRLEVAHGVDPNQMPTLMNAADCLILTSVSEGSSNVVKEALACNLPVVATPVGDVPELLAGVRLCAVCDPSPEALGDALARNLADGGRSDGRQRTERLDDGRIGDRLIALYRESARGGH